MSSSSVVKFIVEDLGVQKIQKWVKERGLPPLPDTFCWEWNPTEWNLSGTEIKIQGYLTARIRNYYKFTHNVNLNERQITDLARIAADHLVEIEDKPMTTLPIIPDTSPTTEANLPVVVTESAVIILPTKTQLQSLEEILDLLYARAETDDSTLFTGQWGIDCDPLTNQIVIYPQREEFSAEI